MTDENEKLGTLEVHSNGRVTMSPRFWEWLRRHTGRKSRKRRHVKKAIQKLMCKIIAGYYVARVKQEDVNGKK